MRKGKIFKGFNFPVSDLRDKIQNNVTKEQGIKCSCRQQETDISSCKVHHYCGQYKHGTREWEKTVSKGVAKRKKFHLKRKAGSFEADQIQVLTWSVPEKQKAGFYPSGLIVKLPAGGSPLTNPSMSADRRAGQEQ